MRFGGELAPELRHKTRRPYRTESGRGGGSILLTDEQLRRNCRPKRVRLLFVGESPPASGRFFYRRNSGLYRAMRDVFAAVDPSVNDENFLETFQSSGCYLVDLCSQPVDQMSAPLRRATCRASEPFLARTIAHLRPQMIATMLRSIETSVSNAVATASWTGPLLQLPYPGRWAHLEVEFVTRLLPAIERLLRTTEPL